MTNEIPNEWRSYFRRVVGMTSPDTLRSEPPRDYDPERGAEEIRKSVEDLRKRIPLLSSGKS
jgi:hypothetical protein